MAPLMDGRRELEIVLKTKRFEEKRFAIFVFSHTLKNINWMNLGYNYYSKF